MQQPGVSPQELNGAQIDAQIEALKWLAAMSADPLDRIQAILKIFQLRNQQLEQGRTL